MSKVPFVNRLNYHISEAQECFGSAVAWVSFSAIMFLLGYLSGAHIFTIVGIVCGVLGAFYSGKNFIHRTHEGDMRAIAHLHGVDLKAPSESATASSDTSAIRTTSV